MKNLENVVCPINGDEFEFQANFRLDNGESLSVTLCSIREARWTDENGCYEEYTVHSGWEYVISYRDMEWCCEEKNVDEFAPGYDHGLTQSINGVTGMDAYTLVTDVLDMFYASLA